MKNLIKKLAVMWYGEEEYNLRRMAKDAGCSVKEYAEEQARIECLWTQNLTNK